MFYSRMVSSGSNSAALVIEFSGSVISSINLYSSLEASYNSFYAKLNLILDDTFKNADPINHEGVHQEFARLYNVEAEKTKTFHTHFHWRGSVDFTKEGVLVHLFTSKVITKQQMLEIIGMAPPPPSDATGETS